MRTRPRHRDLSHIRPEFFPSKPQVGAKIYCRPKVNDHCGDQAMTVSVPAFSETSSAGVSVSSLDPVSCDGAASGWAAAFPCASCGDHARDARRVCLATGHRIDRRLPRGLSASPANARFGPPPVYARELEKVPMDAALQLSDHIYAALKADRVANIALTVEDEEPVPSQWRQSVASPR